MLKVLQPQITDLPHKNTIRFPSGSRVSNISTDPNATRVLAAAKFAQVPHSIINGFLFYEDLPSTKQRDALAYIVMIDTALLPLIKYRVNSMQSYWITFYSSTTNSSLLAHWLYYIRHAPSDIAPDTDYAPVFEALNTRLGEAQYFSGKAPGYLDACIFSILHSVLTLFPKNSDVFRELSLYENLVEYTARVHQMFFSPL